MNRRGFLGALMAIPFVPKIVEAAQTVKETAEFVHFGFYNSAGEWENYELGDSGVMYDGAGEWVLLEMHR